MTATAQKTLRCATVGVGKMGRHHARLYATTDGCDLVGVVEQVSLVAGHVVQRPGVRRERVYV